METARLAPSPRYYAYPPPPAPFLHDLHPALVQYISYYSEPLAPLDLSVKPSPITPPCTPPPAKDDRKTPPRILRHFEEESEPAEKREDDEESGSPEVKKLKFSKQFFEELRSCLPERAATPEAAAAPEVERRPRKAAPAPPPPPAKRSKAARRLQFAEDTTSPVSGTIIRDLADDETLVVRKGDIDPAFNVVEITDEAKALIAGIDNRIGRYICRLCRRLYPDAFALAQHRCERIVHIEYRCPECDKVFNCPANLASHRRWHKPRPACGGGRQAARRAAAPGDPAPLDPSAEGSKFSCKVCGKTFRRQAYLRKHYQAHDAAGKGSAAEAEPGGGPERSAFRQVRADRAPYARPDSEAYDSFWGDVPRADFGLRAGYAGSTVSSEDSRSLDITGSEDEGGWDGGGGN